MTNRYGHYWQRAIVDTMKRLAAMIFCFCLTLPAWARTWSFGVLPQRSAVLTAQYWNPILDYVARKSGVALELGTRKTALEYSAAEARGEFDFVYNNHIFDPAHEAAAYRVLVRMKAGPLHGQIVVPEDSALRSLAALQGSEVGFPSKNAFVAYAVPMAALYQAGIAVKPIFGGNQEGIMAQLKAGQVPAAAVNSRVMREYAAREGFRYRALWTSEPYLDIPVAVHPRVPRQVMRAVSAALLNMARDPQGLAILKASAALIKQAPPLGFSPATDNEYRNQREAYRLIWQKEKR